MLFGNYYPLKKTGHSCGFDTGKELKLTEMLKFKDVHKI
jgi:hypothetical protein